MNLEDQVCSLDLSMKLKELGVKQESLFYYQNNPYEDGQDDIEIKIIEKYHILNTYEFNKKYPIYSAFTVAELGNILPVYQHFNRDFYVIQFDKNILMVEEDNIRIKYSVGCWFSKDHCTKVFYEDKECDARAKMLIYLIEMNLLSEEWKKQWIKK